jgi:hypothetical protein
VVRKKGGKAMAWQGQIFEREVNCHHGNVLLGQTGIIRLFGGGETRGVELLEADVVICLLPTPPKQVESPIGIPEEIAHYFDLKVKMPPVIHLPIQDYSTPKFGRRLWLKFVAGLEKLATEFAEENGRPLDLLVYCTGGHGRTGMVLAILAWAFGLTKTDPVAFVRRHYCHEAVETTGQEVYVEQVTGIKVKRSVKAKGFDWDTPNTGVLTTHGMGGTIVSGGAVSIPASQKKGGRND